MNLRARGLLLRSSFITLGPSSSRDPRRLIEVHRIRIQRRWRKRLEAGSLVKNAASNDTRDNTTRIQQETVYASEKHLTVKSVKSLKITNTRPQDLKLTSVSILTQSSEHAFILFFY